MERYIIPAFFVVDADSPIEAKRLIGNFIPLDMDRVVCRLDEELPTKRGEMLHSDYLPHTYNDSSFISI